MKRVKAPLAAPTTSLDSDERYTPKWLASLIVEFNGDAIEYDPCTTALNFMGAAVFDTKQSDGLRADWVERTNVGLTADDPPRVVGGLAYVNPPYSRGLVRVWAEKMVREAVRGVEIAALTQGDSSTDWYTFLRKHADARCSLKRRVSFLEPDGKGGTRSIKGGAKFPSVLWYFGRRRRLFDTFWTAHGEVIHGLGV